MNKDNNDNKHTRQDAPGFIRLTYVNGETSIKREEDCFFTFVTHAQHEAGQEPVKLEWEKLDDQYLEHLAMIAGFQRIEKLTHETRTICVWPDADWCAQEDIEEFEGKSDDYVQIEMSLDMDDEEVETWVSLNFHTVTVEQLIERFNQHGAVEHLPNQEDNQS